MIRTGSLAFLGLALMSSVALAQPDSQSNRPSDAPPAQLNAPGNRVDENGSGADDRARQLAGDNSRDLFCRRDAAAHTGFALSGEDSGRVQGAGDPDPASSQGRPGRPSDAARAFADAYDACMNEADDGNPAQYAQAAPPPYGYYGPPPTYYPYYYPYPFFTPGGSLGLSFGGVHSFRGGFSGAFHGGFRGAVRHR